MPKRLQGRVVSDKQEKTIIVDVQRRFAHPMYKKIIKRNKRYQVHCEDTKSKVGDKVIMEETKPISKKKRFRVVQKLT